LFTSKGYNANQLVR